MFCSLLSLTKLFEFTLGVITFDPDEYALDTLAANKVVFGESWMSLRFLEEDDVAVLFVCQLNEYRSRDITTGGVVQSMVVRVHKSCPVWRTHIGMC